VTAASPLIETTPAVSTVVSQREIQTGRSNGRQFATSVARTGNDSLGHSDPPAGQLTIALMAKDETVNFLVDGGDNTDDTIGGALQNYNIEPFRSSNIQTQQYKAIRTHYRRRSNVVTKSGTNEISGSAYEFYRAKSLMKKRRPRN